MSELEDRINSVLGDPKQMDMITKLARSLMAGGDGGGTESAHAEEPPNAMPDALDTKLMARLARLMQGGGEKKQERALLEAMMPYMSEKRRSKMSTAIKIARIAGIARQAMGEMGAEEVD